MSEPDSGDENEDTTVEPADFAPGALVVDREDDDPTVAVVLNTPPVPADEWTVPRLGRTVAEDNPDYSTESPVVVVAFRDHLEEQVPEWDDHEGYWPITELNEQQVRYYAFPAARLEHVAAGEGSEAEVVESGASENDEDSESSEDGGGAEPEPEPEPEPAVDLDGLTQRLEDAGCAVTRRDRGLRVSKLGEMYLIKPSGQVEGDGALRDRLADIVDQFEEDDR